MSENTTFLDPEDVCRLTGYKRHAEQRKQLWHMGIKFVVSRLGKVRPQAISPQAIYKFRDIISKNGKVQALDKGIIAERFAEHDLRAKTASDTDLKHAASLLTHDDIKTTQKHYRRKAEIVRPLQ